MVKSINTITDAENFEFNITWAINNASSVADYGYSVYDYVYLDLVALADIRGVSVASLRDAFNL